MAPCDMLKTQSHRRWDDSRETGPGKEIRERFQALWLSLGLLVLSIFSVKAQQLGFSLRRLCASEPRSQPSPSPPSSGFSPQTAAWVDEKKCAGLRASCVQRQPVSFTRKWTNSDRRHVLLLSDHSFKSGHKYDGARDTMWLIPSSMMSITRTHLLAMILCTMSSVVRPFLLSRVRNIPRFLGSCWATTETSGKMV